VLAAIPAGANFIWLAPLQRQVRESGTYKC
jgi:hypothetical protein